MVGTLRRAGVEVVVFNRTRPKAEAVAEATGAVVAASAREAVDGAQVVLSSLADDAAVGAAYTGGDGIVAGLQPGTIVCESSTIDPGTVHRLRPLVDARRASLLDTPVSGSVSTVEAGQLTIMAGGDPEVLERARPVLDPLAKQIFHVGDLGSGAVDEAGRELDPARPQPGPVRRPGPGRTGRGGPRGRLRGVRGQRHRRPLRPLQAGGVRAPRPAAGRLQPRPGRQGPRRWSWPWPPSPAPPWSRRPPTTAWSRPPSPPAWATTTSASWPPTCAPRARTPPDRSAVVRPSGA